MSQFKPYPAYKDSGVALLGEFPDHWQLKRFKNVFEERAERSLEGTEDLLSVSAYFGIKPRSETLDEGDHLSRAESLEGYKVCHSGDLVINIMLAWNRGLGFAWQKGIVSPAYSVFHIVDKSIPKFLDYLVRSDECIRYFKTHSAGIMDSRLRLYPESFGRLYTAIPPIFEQTQIARFLDHETARIDALIEEQQRLIELLKEKRQAVISHAVTKGLDPTVPMKDSGVEWLGEVPDSWSVRKLKNVVSVRGGSTPSKEVESYWVGNIPWVSPKDMKSECISDSIDHVSMSALQEGGLNMVARGAVLIVVRGMILIHSVPVALTEVDVTINQDMKAMTPLEELKCDYLLLLLQGVRDAVFQYIDSSAHGTKKLEWERFELIDLPIPPHAEQLKIISFIERQKRAIDDLDEQARTVISLMDERRSALISAAVTGKIDVRGWQPVANASSPAKECEAV